MRVKNQARRALRHPMWRAGIIVGILIGLALPSALRWVDAQHSEMVEAQWEADFGESREFAKEIKEQQERSEMEIGKYEATYGQQPIVGGKPRMSSPINDW